MNDPTHELPGFEPMAVPASPAVSRSIPGIGPLPPIEPPPLSRPALPPGPPGIVAQRIPGGTVSPTPTLPNGPATISGTLAAELADSGSTVSQTRSVSLDATKSHSPDPETSTGTAKSTLTPDVSLSPSVPRPPAPPASPASSPRPTSGEAAAVPRPPAPPASPASSPRPTSGEAAAVPRPTAPPASPTSGNERIGKGRVDTETPGRFRKAFISLIRPSRSKGMFFAAMASLGGSAYAFHRLLDSGSDSPKSAVSPQMIQSPEKQPDIMPFSRPSPQHGEPTPPAPLLPLPRTTAGGIAEPRAVPGERPATPANLGERPGKLPPITVETLPLPGGASPSPPVVPPSPPAEPVIPAGNPSVPEPVIPMLIPGVSSNPETMKNQSTALLPAVPEPGRLPSSILPESQPDKPEIGSRPQPVVVPEAVPLQPPRVIIATEPTEATVQVRGHPQSPVNDLPPPTVIPEVSPIQPVAGQAASPPPMPLPSPTVAEGSKPEVITLPSVPATPTKLPPPPPPVPPKNGVEVPMIVPGSARSEDKVGSPSNPVAVPIIPAPGTPGDAPTIKVEPPAISTAVPAETMKPSVAPGLPSTTSSDRPPSELSGSVSAPRTSPSTSTGVVDSAEAGTIPPLIPVTPPGEKNPRDLAVPAPVTTPPPVSTSTTPSRPASTIPAVNGTTPGETPTIPGTIPPEPGPGIQGTGTEVPPAKPAPGTGGDRPASVMPQAEKPSATRASESGDPGNTAKLPQEPPRTDYDVDLHIPRAGETFASISRQHYGDEKYAEALQAYNAGRSPGSGTPLQIPPMYILRQQYPQLIGSSRPSATYPNPPTTPPARFLPERTREQVTERKVETPSGGVEWLPASRENGSRVYLVSQSGLKLWDIAEEIYGDRQEWKRIWQANPQLDPNQPLNPGTSLRLP